MSRDYIHWPQNASFALFLSHDLDQIHDREMFRILADVNHMRRVATQGEQGNIRLATTRILRGLLRPRPTGHDVQTMLEIEARHGFRSTFFILDDPYWSRNGPRYRLNSAGLDRIAEMVLASGGELGVHGGYYRFNNPDGYRESRERVGALFGVEVSGIRNHLLRFSYPDTWLAQEAAGYRYDTTFALKNRPGVPEGRFFPFRPVDPVSGRTLALTVLPLTVMDVTLFRNMKLRGADALEAAWKAIEPIIEQGGLVTLLWHNNYFNEPEYAEWQWVYERLLERLAALNPWCATGAEIESWCRSRWEMA